MVEFITATGKMGSVERYHIYRLVRYSDETVYKRFVGYTISHDEAIWNAHKIFDAQAGTEAVEVIHRDGLAESARTIYRVDRNGK